MERSFWYLLLVLSFGLELAAVVVSTPVVVVPFLIMWLWPIIALLQLGAAGTCLVSLRYAEDWQSAVSWGWWLMQALLPAVVSALWVHAALCGLDHTIPGRSFVGFAIAGGLVIVAIGAATRGAWRPAGVLLLVSSVLFVGTWARTDRQGMMVGAATKVPAPALYLLLADGRPADVEPLARSFDWSPYGHDRPLRQAARAGRTDAVRLLLRRGADPLYDENIYLSLVVEALDSGDHPTAEALLEGGAGRSPVAMERMAQRGDVASVAWLLEHGANVGLAAFEARQAGHTDIVRLLSYADPPTSRTEP